MSLADLAGTVVTLKEKIKAASETATAEDLAYLATAAERIGAATTIIELIEQGNVQKAELSANYTQITDDINTIAQSLLAELKSNATAVKGQSTDAHNTLAANSSALVTQLESTMHTLLAASAVTIKTGNDEAKAEIDALRATLVEDAEALRVAPTAHSLFYASAFG